MSICIHCKRETRGSRVMVPQRQPAACTPFAWVTQANPVLPIRDSFWKFVVGPVHLWAHDSESTLCLVCCLCRLLEPSTAALAEVIHSVGGTGDGYSEPGAHSIQSSLQRVNKKVFITSSFCYFDCSVVLQTGLCTCGHCSATEPLPPAVLRTP